MMQTVILEEVKVNQEILIKRDLLLKGFEVWRLLQLLPIAQRLGECVYICCLLLRCAQEQEFEQLDTLL